MADPSGKAMSGHQVPPAYALRRSHAIRASAQPAVELRRVFADLDTGPNVVDLATRLFTKLHTVDGAMPGNRQAIDLVKSFARYRLDQLRGPPHLKRQLEDAAKKTA